MSDMLNYLQAMKNMTLKMRMPAIEAIVLEHGKPFIPPVCPRPHGIPKGKVHECFRNSYHLAQTMFWTYVEGFAIASGVPIPLHHAWVVDHHGNVIETTWKDAGVEYYGIPLDLKFVNAVMLDTLHYGVLDYRSPTFRQRYSL
jgi:hypothetical protein